MSLDCTALSGSEEILSGILAGAAAELTDEAMALAERSYAGGRVVVAGTPEEVASCPASVTGRYIAEELG